MKYEIGDAVKISDKVFPLSISLAKFEGKWGMIADIAEKYYYIFFPEYPYPTKYENPSVMDLCYVFLADELEPLNETKV